MKWQLNLRDLFWLILVAAIACGWWMERQRSSELALQVAGAAEREKELRKHEYILTEQLGKVQLKLAQEGFRFHFDIYEYPDGKIDVRFIDDE